jgi:hypothetical protein
VRVSRRSFTHHGVFLRRAARHMFGRRREDRGGLSQCAGERSNRTGDACALIDFTAPAAPPALACREDHLHATVCFCGAQRGICSVAAARTEASLANVPENVVIIRAMHVL